MNTAVATDTIQHVATTLQDALAKNNSVLWLISGGSAIDIAVQVRQQLSLGPGKQLHVGLIDERYGPLGHADSNYQQLLDAGFDTAGVTMHPILHEDQSAESTTLHYSLELQFLLDAAGFRLGLFGIGADAHTAGMLPHSTPIGEQHVLVSAYQGPDYMRITTTPLLVAQLDEAVLYAVGENKWPAIQLFLDDGPADAVPARIIKTAKAYTLYTDYKGETV